MKFQPSNGKSQGSFLTKNLLLISYHFPPDLAVGAIRPGKLWKFLQDHGWNVKVLTVPVHCYPRVDSHYKEEESHTKIQTVAPWPNIRDAYLWLKNLNIWRRGLPVGTALENEWVPPETAVSETKKQMLKRYVQSLLVWLPDDKMGWVPSAVPAGVKEVRHSGIDAVMTTSPPNSVQLIGLAIKRWTGIPWLADFRDPWGWEMKPIFVRSGLSDAVDAWMESKVVASADRVISVTPEMTARLVTRYPVYRKDKFLTISNGFDPEDFKVFEGAAKRHRITFTYAGSFYLGRDPETFLCALKKLSDNKQLELDNVCVRLIGNCRYLYGKSIEAIVSRLQLQDVVRFIDPVPRNQAICEMARSHVLLLFAPDQPLQIPAKVFEYIGLGSWILAVCGPGATQNLLRGYSRAVVVAPNDMVSMEEGILQLIRCAEKHTIDEYANTSPDSYRYSNLAAQLATILDTATDKKR